MNSDLFPKFKDRTPRIYVYSDSHPDYEGLLKIGYTTLTAKKRVKQQYPTSTPGNPTYKIQLDETAVRNDGSTFTDKDVHNLLKINGFNNLAGEWFRCKINDVRDAVQQIKLGELNPLGRPNHFKMRPEQIAAVEKTSLYFNNFCKHERNGAPRFLWNAKMRFGKTFTSYQLALRMNWKRLLVLTFKPAVQSAWEYDLCTHKDFADWQFIKKDGLSYEDADKSKPFVCFGSFQDFLGKNKAGGIKLKNEWAHCIDWDCVILDEYHYGAWRERTNDLFCNEDDLEVSAQIGEGIEYFDENNMPIKTNHYLYLSGTPFRALASGEFIEEQIFNWTYTDEQRAKEQFDGEDNPYSVMPRMVIMTYQMPDRIRDVISQGKYDEFDLNAFFSTTNNEDTPQFNYKSEVQMWLDLIRGQSNIPEIKNIRLAGDLPRLPFSDVNLLSQLNHSFWFLPTVASCHAMKNLLNEKHNLWFRDYKVIVAAGNSAGIGVEALNPVMLAMDNPLETKTITLSCGKLTTGVTVRPWTGILMLRNSSSPETYFQAAFRVQTPWVIDNPDGLSPNKKEVIKDICYVFDFAPTRALRQIAEYSCRLNINESDPEDRITEFTNFLPVLAFDGSSMNQLNASEILDIAMSGTTATLLARKWESPHLVNVDNNTLSNLLNNEKAMKALMNIEGFRRLNTNHISTIINTSEEIKNTKLKANKRNLSSKEKKELSQKEKVYKKYRKLVQEKLMKFVTRIPLFMYLTDYREKCLKDIIIQLEPKLFKNVTGLSVEDFELLVKLNLFNSTLMNDAVYKFKRYEDSSLNYSGINKHDGQDVGLFDKIIQSDEIS